MKGGECDTKKEMVKTKKMDEAYFANFLKETTVYGELIRARQDEKQSLVDEFDRESKRFYFGKISEKAISSSVEKTNKELTRIDKEIKSYMKKANANLQKAIKLVNDQEPKTFKATLSAVKDSRSSSKTSKKKSSSKTKKASGSSKKKTVKKASPKPAKKTKATKATKKTAKKASGSSKKKTSSKKKK